jgi:Chaperone of endosialidase/LVIVD repeat
MTPLDGADEIFFDGVRYISAGDAARDLGVVRDYIARLCRQGRIRGRQVGKNWYAEVPSLHRWAIEQNHQRALRSEALVRERAEERRAAQSSSRNHHGATSTSGADTHAPESGVPATAIVSNASGELHRKLANAVSRGSLEAASRATALSARASSQVPLYAVSPTFELLHKIAAAVLALTLVVGLYALGNSLIATSPELVPGTAVTPQIELGAAAGLVANTFSNIAGGLQNEIAFLASLFRARFASSNPEGGLVSVQVTPGRPQNPPAPAIPPSAPLSRPSTQTIVENNPIVERVIQSENVIASGGITEDEVDQKLQQLDNSLSAQMYSLTSANSTAIAQNYNVTAQTNAIDQLSGTAITNPDITGGSITNANISGGTISGGIISGATFSGTTTLETLAVSGGATSTFASGIDITAGCFAIGGTCITSSGGGAGNPGGSDTQVQFNEAGSFGGSASFTFATSTNLLTVLNASTTLFSALGPAYFGSTATSSFAANGALTLAQPLAISSGGTGTSTTPSFGQVLVGNSSGGYNLVATSSLGISPSLSFYYPLLNSSNTVSLAFGTTTANAWSQLQTFNGGASTTNITASGIGYFASASTTNLTISGAPGGFLQTNASGVVSATSTFPASGIFGILGVGNGGTGTSLAPSYGQILVGNAANGYTLAATSSLGLASLSSFSASSPLSYNSGTGAFSIQQASASQNGFIASADWTTFNNKVSSTSLSGGAGISYTASTGVITNTGVTSIAGTANQIAASGSTGAVTLSLPNLVTLTNASSSQLSVFGNAYFGGTATSTFDSAGDLSVAGTLNATGKTTLGNASTSILSVSGNSYLATAQASTFALSSVVSCTGSEALQTDGSGNISCGAVSSGGSSAGGGWLATGGAVNGTITESTSTYLVAVGATTTPYAKFSVLSGATGTTTLALVAASGQTADILDIYGSSGGLNSVFTSGGSFGIGTTSPGSTLSIGGSGYLSGALSVSGLANFFNGASTTNITASGTGYFTTASTTNLTVAGVPSALLSTNASGVVGATTFSGPLSLSGSTLTLTQANASTNGYLSSSDWTNFNNKVGSTSLSGASIISYTGTTGVITTTGGTFGAGNYVFPANLTVQGNASTTLFSSYGPAYFGGSATSSFSSTGALTLATQLTVPNGGTGSTTLTGLLKGNGTGSLLTAIAGTDYQAPITASYPILFSANNLSLAFGTTTNNTFSGTQTFLNIAATNATTTSLYVTGITSHLLKTDSNGQVVSAIAGTDYQAPGTYLTALGNYSTTTGASVSLSTTTVTTNGVTYGQTIAVSPNGILFTPTVLGTLTNAGLSNSSITFASSNSTLTASGAVSLGGTANYDLNLAHSNFFTALENFTNASTSQLTATSSVYFTALPNDLLATNQNGQVVGTTSVSVGYLTGTLPVANGGTGWPTINSGTLLYGNGSSALATTTAATGGQYLSFLNGVPTWVASTTFSAPLSWSNGAVSVSQANGSTNGYLSSSDWTNFNNKVGSTSLSGASIISYTGTTGVITTTGGTFGAGNYVFPANLTVQGNASTTLFSSYGPAYFGGSATSSFGTDGSLTLATALSVGNGGTGATTASAARSNLAAAASGANSDITSLSGLTTALSIPQGGTGWTTINSNTVLLGNGTGALSTTTRGNLTETGSSILTITGGANALLGSGTTIQVQQANGSQPGFLSSADWTTFNNKAPSASPTFTGTANFTNINVTGTASTSLFSSYGLAYFGGTATSTFDSAGNLSLVSNGLNVGSGQLVVSGGNVGIGTTTPGSLLSLNSIANFTAATSTFYSTGGINLTSGCFAVGGNCLTSGASFSGTAGQVDYFTGTNTAAGTSTLFITPTGQIGIATTTPGVVSGANQYLTIASKGSNTLPSLELAGYAVATNNTVGRISFFNQYGGNEIARISSAITNDAGQGALIFSTANDGAVAEAGRFDQFGDLGIGTTTPGSLLSVGNSNGINFSTATSTFSSTGGINLAAGCFAIASNCLSLGTLSGTISLATQVSGTLPVGNGGTGQTTFTSNGILFGQNTGGIGVTASSASALLVTNSSGVPSLSTTLPAVTLGGAVTGNAQNLTGLNNLSATGLSQFTNASSSLLSVFGPAYFGATATSSFGTNGSLTLAGLGTFGSGFVSQASSTVAGQFTVGGTPVTQFTVASSSVTRLSQSALANAVGGDSIYVQGRYAYIAEGGGTTNAFEIYDVSTPSSPTRLSQSTLANAGDGDAISVQGNYAYIVENAGANGFEIWNVSSPNAPVRVSESTLANSGTFGRTAIYVQGRYAYIVEGVGTTNAFEIWDVSNPSAPVRVSQGTLNNGSGGDGIYVQGRYAYIAEGGGTTNAFEIWDVSNPSSPVRSGEGTLKSGATNGGDGIYVQGAYAYIADGNGTTNAFEVWNVASSTNPFRVGQGTLNNSNSSNPDNVYVQGRYAYITEGGGTTNAFEVWDVSAPTSPTRVTQATLANGGGGRSDGLFVSGRYAYIAEGGGTTTGFEIFDLGGGYIQQLEAGGLEAGTLVLRNNLSALDGEFAGGLTVGGSLAVTGSASIVSATSTYNTTDNIFNIATASSTSPIFSVLGNGNIGVGTTTPWGRLSVDTSNLTAGEPEFTVSSSTRNDFLITQAGNVGIGTTTPTSSFTLQSTAGPAGTALNVYGAGATMAMEATNVTGYSGMNLYDNMGSLSGSFSFGGYSAGAFTNQLVMAARGSTTTLGFYTTSSGVLTQQMAITSAGNVGIGTTTPGSPLVVSLDQNNDTNLNITNYNSGSSAGANVRTTNNAGNLTELGMYSTARSLGVLAAGDGYVYGNGSNLDLIAGASGGAIKFAAGGTTEQMRLTSSGNLGIGTTTPINELSINGGLDLEGGVNAPLGDPGLFLGYTGGVGTILAIDQGSVFEKLNVDASTLALNSSSGGNVGIGTSTPGSLLTLSSSVPQISLYEGASNRIMTIGSNDGFNGIINAASGNLYLQPNAGSVGIGTTTSSAMLDVNGFIRSTSAAGTPSTGTGLEILQLSSTDGVVQDYNRSSSAYENLDLYGTAVTIHNTSDQRLKTNITPLASSTLDEILALNPVTFNWKDVSQSTSTQVGLIAQEVQNVFPNLVTAAGTTTITLANGSTQTIPNVLTLNYEGFIVPLIKAVQEIATISGTFEQNLIAWLGNASNGIGQLFANEVDTQRLCVTDGPNDPAPVCVTKAQLAALLAGQTASAASSGSGGGGAAGSNGGASGSSSDATSSPPVIQINGDNPAIVQVGAIYNDLGATITGPQADLNLGIATFVNGVAMSPVQIDTSQAATDTIDYVDQSGLTSTSTRTVIVVAPQAANDNQASSTPSAANDNLPTPYATGTDATSTP